MIGLLDRWIFGLMDYMQNLKSAWEILDEQIRGWWDADLRQAQEAEIRDKALNAIW
ncbi:hypothetical protein L0337_06960 [candidate division KSB1 bacterium]|nr:hypothetical protein [candidate division KSB1 bacterium]